MTKSATYKDIASDHIRASPHKSASTSHQITARRKDGIHVITLQQRSAVVTVARLYADYYPADEASVWTQKPTDVTKIDEVEGEVVTLRCDGRTFLCVVKWPRCVFSLGNSLGLQASRVRDGDSLLGVPWSIHLPHESSRFFSYSFTRSATLSPRQSAFQDAHPFDWIFTAQPCRRIAHLAELLHFVSCSDSLRS